VTDETDPQLLARARTHPEAIGALYERHAPAVFRFLARRVGHAGAEDLLGEVFVAALAGRLRVVPHESGSALPWLYGIAGNVVRSHLRSRPQPGAGAHDPGVDWDAVDDRLDAASRRRELRAALGALTPAERDLLLLVAWEGLSPAEAAAALGLTPTAARSRLHRARHRAQVALDSTLERTL
jgi:RNA polymerase sigma factor (sigma-70 family)